MAEMSALLKQFEEEVRKVDAGEITPEEMKDITIPQDISNVSIGSTLTEITALSNMCYAVLRKNPNNPIMLNKLVTLLEIKSRMTGIYNVKADTQEIIDNEINTFKKRFLQISVEELNKEQLHKICNRLSKEGM